MKNIVLLLLMVATLSAQDTASKNIGVGVIFGEPTGISVRYWGSANHAYDGAVSWSFTKNVVIVQVDYAMKMTELKLPTFNLPIFVGPGVAVGFKENPWVNARVKCGVAYQFPQHPIDVFAELVPALELIPDVGFDLMGGIGVRYFF
ncbi:MAG: hypothetical protein OCD01_18030 [Fibrobacterales bacterium]